MDKIIIHGIENTSDLISMPIKIDGERRIVTSVESSVYLVDSENRLVVVEYIEHSIGSVTTSTIGSNFVSLPSGACRAVEIINNHSGIDIEYRRNGAGDTFPIPAMTLRRVTGITNSNQIEIRRVDLSNSTIQLKFARLV